MAYSIGYIRPRLAALVDFDDEGPTTVMFAENSSPGSRYWIPKRTEDFASLDEAYERHPVLENLDYIPLDPLDAGRPVRISVEGLCEGCVSWFEGV